MTSDAETMLQQRPRWWPHFTSTLRSTAVTARLGRVLGIAFAILFVTGLLSHYQYQPWSWLPQPAAPVWGYRLTQGIHVAVGTATIAAILLGETLSGKAYHGLQGTSVPHGCPG